MKTITLAEILLLLFFATCMGLIMIIPSMAAEQAHKDWCAEHMCLSFPVADDDSYWRYYYG